jgi:hypothetical protein
VIEYGTRADETIETRIAVESVKERVYSAVKELCIGGSDVRGRLIISVNILMALSPEEFPEDIKDDFNWVIQQSTKFKSDLPEYKSGLEKVAHFKEVGFKFNQWKDVGYWQGVIKA